MTILAAAAGATLNLVILWEGFEVIVLPRRVTRRFRLSVYFFWTLWHFWTYVVGVFPSRKQKETWLGFFGPLSLILLLTAWAGGLIVGFALLLWSTGPAVRGMAGNTGFLTDLYLSGTTFFTLGLGDVVPTTALARALVILESGMGFGFFALVISYLPPLNQSFGRREVNISLLDARAGSPPSATEMLRRHSHDHAFDSLEELLAEWEHWSAEFLESHLSYPVLAYFRSQHDSQSWLGALTAILDTCALVMTHVETNCRRQAELTFAIARHAVVDLTLIFRRPPRAPVHDRLPPEKLAELRAMLAAAGLKLREGDAADQELAELRRMYEPYVNALAMQFLFSLPPWLPDRARRDNWQARPWEGRTHSASRDSADRPGNEHFLE